MQMSRCHLSLILLCLLASRRVCFKAIRLRGSEPQSGLVTDKLGTGHEVQMNFVFYPSGHPPPLFTGLLLGLILIPFLFVVFVGGGWGLLQTSKDYFVAAQVDPVLYVGEPVCFRATTNLSGAVDWSVLPVLPRGLQFDPTIGCLRGTPLGKAQERSYQLFASTRTAYAVGTIQFQVMKRPTVAVKFEYPDAPVCLACNSAVYLPPRLLVSSGLHGKAEKVDARLATFIFSAKPELPEGISLATSTGVISGCPKTSVGSRTYTITAQCEDDSISCALVFSVADQAPRNLVYAGLSLPFVVGKLVTLQPAYEGMIAEWKVSPELPEGLSLDACSGRIEGVPKVPMPTGTWEVEGKYDKHSTSATLKFGVESGVASLQYVNVVSQYPVGRPLELLPTLEGGSSTEHSFSVKPPLPSGLALAPGSGIISGAPESPSPASEYVVTAATDVSSCTATLRFGATVLPPAQLCYPRVDDDYFVGEPVHLEPEMSGGATRWKVEPALPQGLRLDEVSGIISGTPTAEREDVSYTITASNEAGGTSVILSFAVVDDVSYDVSREQVTERLRNGAYADLPCDKFADFLDQIDSIDRMPPSPPHGSQHWMIWIVHRAWLDDPTLEVVNFSNLTIPAPYVEPRIATKLMKAMEWNTNVQEVLLCNSGLQSSSCNILAESLRSNNELRVLNIERNLLDSQALSSIALGLAEAEDSALETWILSCNHCSPNLEHSLAQMAEHHTNITKLGYYVPEPEARRRIDKGIMRNVDKARRRRKRRTTRKSTAKVSVEKVMTRIMLTMSLAHEEEEHRAMDSERIQCVPPIAFRYAIEHARVPSRQQLQNYAATNDVKLSFGEVAPALRDFRDLLFELARQSPVHVVDAYGKEQEGSLLSWSDKNGRWEMRLAIEGTPIAAFVSDREIDIVLSKSIVEWLASRP